MHEQPAARGTPSTWLRARAQPQGVHSPDRVSSIPAAGSGEHAGQLPFLALVRDSTAETQWPGGWTLPAGAAVIACTPFFHRDVRRLPYADRFQPEVWLDGRAEAEWSIAPFSHGPARCLGKEIVLSTSAMLLTELLGRDWRTISPHRPGPGRPLPRTADHTSLRFVAGDRAVHG